MSANPMFDWLKERAAGVLLHPTALPGDFGIGNFGQSAHRFLEWMKACGLNYWQMLPLGPTGFGESPYQAYSSYALNPLLLGWEEFFFDGTLTPEDLRPLTQFPRDSVAFDGLMPLHAGLRSKVITRTMEDPERIRLFKVFSRAHARWLEPWSLFVALKEVHSGAPWYEWPKKWRHYPTARGAKLSPALSKMRQEAAFLQFLLYQQWQGLRDEATASGIRIVGDIPIYVAGDSADVWCNPEVFQLEATSLKPSHVAGVPPDYFNSEGQLWGNPLYNWKCLEDNQFSWWIARLKHTLLLFDAVRLDHFRAMASYWSVPAKADSARSGEWVQGPGLSFFKALKSEIPEAKIILEDLGHITPDVLELRDATGFPGLAVLHFAFGGESSNFYLPHNHSANMVVYTGTHDNDTSSGWYAKASENEKDHLRRYLRVDASSANWDLIRSAWASVANLCIVPIQDYLGLGSDARFNTPGTATGNWRWRCTENQLARFLTESSAYLKELSRLYGRRIFRKEAPKSV